MQKVSNPSLLVMESIGIMGSFAKFYDRKVELNMMELIMMIAENRISLQKRRLKRK